MPSLTGSLEQGRIIVDVGIQPALTVVQGVTAESSPPVVLINRFRGLFDTGAQRTCITKQTARALELRPRGKILIGNVSSVERHTTYSFALGFWFNSDPGSQGIPGGYYACEPVMGADFKDNDDFDVLIGMDVIALGDLTVRRNGSFEFVLP